MISRFKKSIWTALNCACLIILVACVRNGVISNTVSPQPSITNDPPTNHPELTQDQILSLESLKRVDDYPLYIMHYFADYVTRQPFSAYLPNQKRVHIDQGGKNPVNDWSCSLFAALGNPEMPLFGRNFDWRYSPALLLFTYPKLGNASVSLVDIEYLVADQAEYLLELPFELRLPLLAAPEWPFDGMNACGLVIGMAAVPSSGAIQTDPQKTSIGSLGIIREILDHTCTVEEAIELMEAFNIRWDDGPELHYLIADVSGEAVLVEFLQGEIQVFPNQGSWHQATNFLLSESQSVPDGICNRYDAISEFMMDNSGKLTSKQAMSLLSQVSQDSTQWSVVYNLMSGEIQLAIGRNYDRPYTFDLEMYK